MSRPPRPRRHALGAKGFTGVLAHRKGDRGAALVMVVGVLIVMTVFALATLAYALRTTDSARRDQDAKSAIAAAQAGIDEYVSRLTSNDNYWSLGNGDASNLAFTTGQTVQGAAGSETYRYQVLSTNASTAADGIIRIAVTGTSSPGSGHPSVSRTLIATLQVGGFLDYMYLSDIEVIDPSIIGGSAACATYYYTGRSAMGGCSNIQWGGNDVVNGPLHSNDALQINGAVNFTDVRTESSWPAITGMGAKTWWGSQNPPLAGRSPAFAPSVTLPSGNAELLKYVSPDVAGTGSPGPGCYYQGATEIVLQGTQMQVRSPMTQRSDTPARCLNVTNRSQWQTISPIPPVIYVDAATSGGCVTGNTAAFTYPLATENYAAGASTAVSWGSAPNYNCMRGTAYVQGAMTGGVTIAGADDVVVTGNLTDSSLAGADVIGLVAGNCVWVYHPVTGGGANIGTAVTKVQAAVLALRHSFLVENWATGSVLGTLNVTGAIAQKFRGPVGTSVNGVAASGYSKNYVYDSRLQHLQPPYFLKPDSTPWKVTSLVDG